MTDTITRLQQTQHRIEIAARLVHRPTEQITLIAVSKKQSADDIARLYQAGVRDFGENYLQEALSKIANLCHFDIQWHFIGHLQTNKTRLVAEYFAWCHTLDSLKIAQRLNDQRPIHLPPLQVCIQINIDQEAEKSGIAAEQLESLALELQDLPNIQLRGLMCIPRTNTTTEETQKSFQRLRLLLEQLRQNTFIKNPEPLDTLSMGMSADLELAVAEGATFVRIGTALFGERQLGERK